MDKNEIMQYNILNANTFQRMMYYTLGCGDSMGDFVHNLKSYKILNAQDIIRLRTYIENKYPNLDANKRADILINTIRNIINGYLKSIPENHHDHIRETLLRTKLISKQEPIAVYDIFEIFKTMDEDMDNFSNTLLDWVNSYLDKPIQIEDLNAYLYGQNEGSCTSSNPQYHTNNLDPIEPLVEKPMVLEEKNLLPSSSKLKKMKQHFNPSPINVLFVGLILIASILFSGNLLQSVPIKAEENNIATQNEIIENKHPHLPDYFTYKKINEDKLKKYLKSRDSLLEEEPYFSSIMNTAKDFGLNPLILFAIAGQEQGFVPKSNPLAEKIANNPFNVFISWQDYNTDIVDSSQIAARTVINLSKDRPEDMDPFQWINRKYAEDKDWWKGVKSIYNRLEREVNDLSPGKI